MNVSNKIHVFVLKYIYKMYLILMYISVMNLVFNCNITLNKGPAHFV